MTDSVESDYIHELSRDLGVLDVTMLGVGGMIGAGIFVITGIAAGIVGPGLILVFVLNGILTMFTAMSYAELGSAMPEAGGGYHWVKEGLPEPCGFLTGWMSWFAQSIAGSLYAIGFGAYFVLLLELAFGNVLGLEIEILRKICAVTIVILLLLINYKGVSKIGITGNIVTSSKVLILGVFVVAGLLVIYAKPNWTTNFVPFLPNGWVSVLVAMGLTFIAFEGYEIIAQAGEELKNPKYNIPRATFLALLIVIPIYCLIAFVAIGAVTVEDGTSWEFLGRYKELGLAEASKQFMPFGAVLLVIGGLLATISALNATTYSSTRVSFAMARDKMLPKKMAAVHEKNRTPYIALFCSGGLMLFMVVAVPLEDVASAASIMFLLLFMQVNAAEIFLRRRIGEKLLEKSGFIVPFYPLFPIIGFCANFAIALYLFFFSPLAWYITIFWICFGLVVYSIFQPPKLTWFNIFTEKLSSYLESILPSKSLNMWVEVLERLGRFRQKKDKVPRLQKKL